MANCCTSIYSLGCFSHCGNVSTTLPAVQSGVHTLEYDFNGMIHTAKVPAANGLNFMLPNIFNECGTASIKIKQPDGTYYSFEDADCFCLTITPTITPPDNFKFCYQYIDCDDTECADNNEATQHSYKDFDELIHCEFKDIGDLFDCGDNCGC